MTIATCAECGGPLPPATRRPRLYCSERCKYRARDRRPDSRDVPCQHCGQLCFGGGGSLPAGERTCSGCRRLGFGKSRAGKSTTRLCESPGCLLPRQSTIHRFCERHARERAEKRMKNRPWNPKKNYVPGHTTANGYGGAHQRERRRWMKVVESGTAACTRCGKPVLPDQEWHLDHNEDRTGYLGVAHAPCNRLAGTKKGLAIMAERRRR